VISTSAGGLPVNINTFTTRCFNSGARRQFTHPAVGVEAEKSGRELGEAHRIALGDVAGVHNRGIDASARPGMAVAHWYYTIVIRQDAQGPGVAGESAVLEGRDGAARRAGNHADHQVGAYAEVAVVPVILVEPGVSVSMMMLGR